MGKRTVDSWMGESLVVRGDAVQQVAEAQGSTTEVQRVGRESMEKNKEVGWGGTRQKRHLLMSQFS